MKPHFLFPASPLNPRMIDEAFQDQAIALKRTGFGTSVIDPEAGYITPKPEEGAVCVYRGWMLSPGEYDRYVGTVASFLAKPLTSREQYLAAHWLPEWYPLVERWTPRTLVVPFGGNDDVDLVAACKGTGWEKFQIKDYVKSLKTGNGSVAASPEQVPEILDNMRKYRGTVEGGVCVRQWEDFLPGSETRYFVVNGRFFGQDGAFDTRAMDILIQVAKLVPSPFWSVDIAMRKADGKFRIVEIGDGQVSDLVGWTPERFAEVWNG